MLEREGIAYKKRVEIELILLEQHAMTCFATNIFYELGPNAKSNSYKVFYF